MLSFYLVWSLSYFTLLWWISRFWSQKENCSPIQTFSPAVTLIIPFRNEAENIPSLAVNLKKISYPNLEILLIDDHSEDGSFQLLKKFFEGIRNVHILKSAAKGKKRAMEYGVKLASGEIVLCTDADCTLPEYWVEKMILPFQDPKVQLVAGAVMVEERSGFLEVFQALDWASILLMTNYSFAKRKGLMCSGANMAYRKSAFEQVNGYEGNREIASGDDEFLLKKISKLYGGDACVYLSSLKTLVMTSPESSWGLLINQRVRWASKWNAHFSSSHTFSAIAAFLTQLVWIGSFYFIVFGRLGVVGLGMVWLVKFLAEKVSLGKVLKSLDQQPDNLSFLATSFLHPFYVVRVGLGALSGKFTWKGRGN